MPANKHDAPISSRVRTHSRDHCLATRVLIKSVVSTRFSDNSSPLLIRQCNVCVLFVLSNVTLFKSGIWRVFVALEQVTSVVFVKLPGQTAVVPVSQWYIYPVSQPFQQHASGSNSMQVVVMKSQCTSDQQHTAECLVSQHRRCTIWPITLLVLRRQLVCQSASHTPHSHLFVTQFLQGNTVAVSQFSVVTLKILSTQKKLHHLFYHVTTLVLFLHNHLTDSQD